MKTVNKNMAVSAILSTVLLLAIAASVFSGLWFSIISTPVPTSSPIVEISGKYFNNHLILTHRVGEPVDINSKVVLNIGGRTESLIIGDYLDEEAKKNGFWDFSETFDYPILFDFDYLEYPDIGINVMDSNYNLIVFEGKSIDVNPISDLDFSISINDQHPSKGDEIIFNLTACNNGNINVSNVVVSFILPDELTHLSNTSEIGSYNNETGIWLIDYIPPDECVQLQIHAVVDNTGSCKYTQLTLLLDGSTSIKPQDFELQIEGLANAINNSDVFPRYKRVELTVIQFGGNPDIRAQIELGPIVVDESNVKDVENKVREITQMTGYTPTDCAIYLGAHTMYKSLNNPVNGGIYNRQVTLIVTDGKPNACCNDIINYTGWSSAFNKDRRVPCDGFDSTKEARDYLLQLLELNTDEDDELDVIAVGESEAYSPWMKNQVVWPEPGYFAPPFIIDNPYYGWVRNCSTYEEFAATIDELFGIIFHKIVVSGEVSSDFLSDPIISNNLDDIIIIAYDD